MIKSLITMLLLFQAITSMAQTTISGIVMNEKQESVAGANIYIAGTYDGASSAADGKFSFTTTATGTQNLVVSMLAYETYRQAGDVSYFKNIKVQLHKTINQLSGVTLTAGSFEAGNNTKASVLKPMDIVTTAGAAGDFVAALQTLPGTSTVSEDGRLFVRGGDASETQVFIDGLRVFQPFNATANNIPTRGRFSPFLFKGITFSTGGYSAEYGQALSGVLLLNSTDQPTQEKTDISVMSVGGGLGHTQIWGDKSLSLNTSYINLAPYQVVVPNDRGARWNKPFESISGEAIFRSKTAKGFFKFYTSFNHTNLDIEQEDINYDDFVRFGLKNNNLYTNTTYKHFFENEWTLTAGASISSDKNNIQLLTNTIKTQETASHLKLKFKKAFSNRLQLNFGAEHFIEDYKEDFLSNDGFTLHTPFTNGLTAAFTEADVFFTNRLAMKIGARTEYTRALEEMTIAPRVSLAYKRGDNDQFSFAYGSFYQNPLTDYLKYDQSLATEKTTHYIFNYQYIANGKTFRAEAYYKNYENLTKYDTKRAQPNSVFTNAGSGYASGLDIFWRDNKSIKNLDYWLSYSYLDTQRDYRNFRATATPNFASKHNLSLVTKYFITNWRSQVGLSYNYGSGRPYDNPNTPAFLAEKTKPYHNISANWAYLLSQQKILYFSVSNVTGFKNVNGYQYADTPNNAGVFNRRAIRPTADAFFFVGFFWTISADKKSNQLDNL